MTNPLVSIIIPCYNGEQFVADAIRSALAQTYDNTEIIVINDGSTDASIDVIRTFGDAVQCIDQPNSGAAHAMNRGAAVSRGDLLQFFDSDDLMYSHKIERKVCAAVESHCDVVHCDADVIDMKTGKSRGVWGTSSKGTPDPVVHALTKTLQTASPMYSRRIFESNGGFRQSASPSYDRDIHMRLAGAGARFHHVPERLYVLRRVAGSLSKRNLDYNTRMQLTLGQETYVRLSECNGLTEDRLAALAGYFAVTGRLALRNGLKPLAAECFRRASEVHPDGGFSQAYSPSMRFFARTFGPQIAERVFSFKRWLFRNPGIA